MQKKNQYEFKIHPGEIKRWAKKSKKQKNTISNIEMLCKTRKEAIKFFDDYSLMVSEQKITKNNTSGKGLKVLTPK